MKLLQASGNYQHFLPHLFFTSQPIIISGIDWPGMVPRLESSLLRNLKSNIGVALGCIFNYIISSWAPQVREFRRDWRLLLSLVSTQDDRMLVVNRAKIFHAKWCPACPYWWVEGVSFIYCTSESRRFADTLRLSAQGDQATKCYWNTEEWWRSSWSRDVSLYSSLRLGLLAERFKSMLLLWMWQGALMRIYFVRLRHVRNLLITLKNILNGGRKPVRELF